MAEPRVIPRGEHTLSRRDIDPDALKVLYRLRQVDHIAYLVGGSVRDLLLGRRPKDFDIGTSAHPYQVKKLFRNCWIIGRRFRLAHVKFGTKVIEVATFRRQVQPGEEIVQDGVPAPIDTADGTTAVRQRDADPHCLHRDNTFGTPEEDAFRRDFTINALFYDIATFSIIDYVGGLDDLRAGVVRSIGDPRGPLSAKIRCACCAPSRSRRGSTSRSIRRSSTRSRRIRHEIARSSPPRLLEEYYKILRAGSAEKTFRGLARRSGCSNRSPRNCIAAPPRRCGDRWRRVDAYRAQVRRRRLKRSPTRFCSAACWCRSVSRRRSGRPASP